MSQSSIEIVENDIELIVKDIKQFFDIMENKKFLIVGGRGFIGTYFVKVLSRINKSLKKPMKITVIDNLITAKDKDPYQDPNITFLEKDISKEIQYADDLDYIIHAASIASPPYYRKHPLETIDVNYQGTRNLLELSKEKKVSGILYLSSSEIYGDPDIIPTPESYQGNVSCTGPRACYDESKRLAETVSILYEQIFKIPVKIARLFNVYGPFLNLDDGRMIPDFMKSAIKESKIIIHSDGSVTRSFCYITDVISALFKILMVAPPGSICNVGNDKEEISVKNAAELIKKIVKTPVEIKYKKSDDPNYVVNNPQRRCPDLSHIRKIINYEPRINFEEGLRRIYLWYTGN